MLFLALLALAASPAEGPAIRLQDTPLARSCKLAAPLAAALRAQTAARLVPSRKNVSADFELSLTRTSGQVQLRLLDAKGTQVLERSLGPQRCDELAVTAALVLERYLADVDWSGSSALTGPPAMPPSGPTPEIPFDRSAPPPRALQPEALSPATAAAPEVRPPVDSPVPSPVAATPLPAPPPAPVAAAVTPAQPPSTAEAAPAPADAAPTAALSAQAVNPADTAGARAVSFEATAGGAVAVADVGVRGQVAVELALKLGAHLRLALSGSWLSQRAVAVTIQDRDRGTLTGQDFTAAATGAFCARWPSLELCGGAGGGAWVPSAWAEGTIAQASSAVAALPMLAAFGRLTWHPWKGALLAVPLGCAFPLGSWQFSVEGTTAALSTPTFSCSLGLQAGWGL